MRLEDATKKYLLSNIMTEKIDFQQQLKLFNKSEKWDSNTLYLFTKIHEYKVKYDFLIPQITKIFERLYKTTEFDMLKSYVNCLKISIEPARLKKLLNNRCPPKNKEEEGILFFKETIDYINNNFKEITNYFDFINSLFNRFHEYYSDNQEKLFISDWGKRKVGWLCDHYINSLEDNHFEKLDRLIIISTFIHYANLSINNFPLSNIILGLLNYVLLLQNNYSVGKYINIFDNIMRFPCSCNIEIAEHLELLFNSYKKLDDLIINCNDDFENKRDAYSIVKNFVMTQESEFSKNEALKSCPSLGSSSVEIALRKLVKDGILERLYLGKRTKYRKRKLKTEN